ncbi:RDD family protein [Asanoa sp. NPDC049573]|uniref:RDD family protein n=1 Tax=Asanoa sp. NPDC049573 TaxID=3155396 RepID=UPI003435C227
MSPGWYKDPAEPTTQRYWDGEGWIGAPIPADATPPDGPPEEPPPPPEPTPPPGGTPAPTSPAGQIANGAPLYGQSHGGNGYPGYGQQPSYGQPLYGQQQTYSRPQPLPVQTMPQPAAMAPAGVPLAPPGLRLVARLIDIVAVLLLNVVVNGWFVYQYVQEVRPYYREFNARAAEGDSLTELMQLTPSAQASRLQIVILLIAFALWFAYEVPAVANTGQTLGKRLVGLRVVRTDGVPKMGFVRSARRWSIPGLSTLLWPCCIGFILQFFDSLWVAVDRPLHQALHDKHARTVVVVARAYPPAGTAPPPPSGGPS